MTTSSDTPELANARNSGSHDKPVALPYGCTQEEWDSTARSGSHHSRD